MTTNQEKHMAEVSEPAECTESFVLQQCLNVITRCSEFSNLTYRVSQTIKDVSVLTVYRDRLLGLFGPDVEPVSLTIDPTGRCLVSVLFKPVQRVSLVSGNPGTTDFMLKLQTVLRLISGKGYVFCPGLPERLLAGKACGRYVEFHRAPFKRFQSPRCPVYYQLPAEMQEPLPPRLPSNKAFPLFKMCPQCRHVAGIVHRLPLAPLLPRGGGTAASGGATPSSQPEMLPRPVEKPALAEATPQHPSDTADAAAAGVTAVPGSTASPLQPAPIPNAVPQNMPALVPGHLPPTLRSLPILLGSSPLPPSPSGLQRETDLPGTAQPNEKQAEESDASVSAFLQNQQRLSQVAAESRTTDAHASLKRSYSEPVGEGRTGGEGDGAPNQTGVKSQATSDALRNVLLRKRIKQDQATAEASSQSEEPEKPTKKAPKEKKISKNICKVCKKNFSSPANLLNHLQRHEGFSGSLPKALKTKLTADKQSPSAALLRLIKSQNTRGSKKAVVSDRSLQFFVKCLNSMMSSPNGSTAAKAAKPPKPSRKSRTKAGSREESRVDEVSDASLHSTVEESHQGSRGERLGERPERPTLQQRSSSGFSAVQTLLEAAAIAGTSPGSPTVSSSSPHLLPDCDAETARFNSGAKRLGEQGMRDPPEASKHRKSPRIASRMRKKQELALQDQLAGSSGSVAASASPAADHRRGAPAPDISRPPAVPHDPAHLTNLDLLSSVSLGKAFMEKASTAATGGQQQQPPQPMVNVPVVFVTSSSLTPSLRQAIPTTSNSTAPSFILQNNLLKLPPQAATFVLAHSNQHQRATAPQPNTAAAPSSGKAAPVRPPPLFLARPGKDGKTGNWVAQPQYGASGRLEEGKLPEGLTKAPGGPTLPSFLGSSRPGETNLNPGLESSQQPLQQRNCGAMDLSKPKLSVEMSRPDAPSILSASGPGDSAGVTSPAGQPPPNFLKLMSMGGADSASLEMPARPSAPLPTLPSTVGPAPKIPTILPSPAPSALIKVPEGIKNLSDATLQSRLFASARDYKIDKTASSSSAPQVHSMISSLGMASEPPQTGAKGGNSAAQQSGSDEIQCGYKWSGSGGQVKERTQMVRELVPLDVMNNFLSKSSQQQQQQAQLGSLPSTLSHSSLPLPLPQGAGPLRHARPAMSGPRHAFGTPRTFLPQHRKSLPSFPSQSAPPNHKAEEQTPHQSALNLTTPKRKQGEAGSKDSASPKKAARGRRQSKKNAAASQASPVPTEPPSTPALSPSTTAGNGYSATTSSAPVPLSPVSPIPTTVAAQARLDMDSLRPGGQPQRFQGPTLAPPATPVTTAVVVPTGSTFSSPSLAAMLRQPLSSKPGPSAASVAVAAPVGAVNTSLLPPRLRLALAAAGRHPGGVEVLYNGSRTNHAGVTLTAKEQVAVVSDTRDRPGSNSSGTISSSTRYENISPPCAPPEKGGMVPPAGIGPPSPSALPEKRMVSPAAVRPLKRTVSSGGSGPGSPQQPPAGQPVVKTEPPDARLSPSPSSLSSSSPSGASQSGKEMVIMALPLKSEHRKSRTSSTASDSPRTPQRSEREGSASPGNLVMDIQVEADRASQRTSPGSGHQGQVVVKHET